MTCGIFNTSITIVNVIIMGNFHRGRRKFFAKFLRGHRRFARTLMFDVRNEVQPKRLPGMHLYLTNRRNKTCDVTDDP